MPEQKLKCFIIMPFSKSSDEHTEEYWTNHYLRFLKPEIEKIPSLQAFRSNELRGDILKEVITDLYDSFIVVADLTDHNANVFWELGIRQSFKYKTITIAEKGTKLPFDISTKNTLFYEKNNPQNDRKFCEDFRKVLVDCLTDPDKSDSIVLETLFGRDRDLSEKNELEDSIKYYYDELFGFLDDIFTFESIGAIKLHYIVKFTSDHSKELSKYFGFHKEPNDKSQTQTFYFLQSIYRIDFKASLHCIIIYPKNSPSRNISVSNPKEARHLYEQMRRDIKKYVKDTFGIQI